MTKQNTVNVSEMTSVQRAALLGQAWETRDSLKDTVNRVIQAEHAYRTANKISVGRAQPTKNQEADPFFTALIDTIAASRAKAGKAPWSTDTTKVFLSRVRKALLDGTDLISEQRKAKTGARTPSGNESDESDDTAEDFPEVAGSVKAGRGQVVSLTIPKGMPPAEVAAGILSALSSSEDYAALAAFIKPTIAKFIGKAK